MAETFHKTNKTWKKINSCLLKNETMSDCSFVVQEDTTITKIPAHKYVLGGYSPEFYSLFYLMETDSNEIPINNVSVENLTKFLEFVYTETTELSLENVGDLLPLAVNYSVDNFKDFCENFLIESVTEENVFTLMDKYFIYKLPNFEIKCAKILRRNERIFEDPTFLEVSKHTLTTILKSDELGLKEVTIFKGVNNWSESYCQKNGQAINSTNKRLALGEEALKNIRFGAMTNEQFIISLNLKNSILTPAEVMDILGFINSNGQTDCQYSGKKRFGNSKMHSLVDISIATVNENVGHTDYVFFYLTVGAPIQLYGFGIFGRAGLNGLDIQNPENLIIQLKHVNGIIVNENTVEIRHDGTNKIYEMLFNNPTNLIPNMQYSVVMKRKIPGKFRNYDAYGKLSIHINVSGISCKINENGLGLAALIFEDLSK